MARAHRLFHTTDLGRYLHGVGRWSSWGENIGWTTATSMTCEQAFMTSSVHRGHILSHASATWPSAPCSPGNKLWVTLFFYG